MHFSNYWPYSKVPPQKLKTLYPIEYEDCMTLLDSILTNEVIHNFKKSDSSIATIEISNGIGGFFITNWALYKYGHTISPQSIGGAKQRMPEKPIDLPSHFIYDGIEHPGAMIRIMFNCYYKYLNNQQYDWQKEIDKMKLYWKCTDNTYYWGEVPDTIEKIENDILDRYYFNQLNVNDTVDILYNRSPRLIHKSPDWYYLTGIIKYKIPKNKCINIQLISIKPQFDKDYLLVGDDTISVGDTLTDFYRGWLKRERYYFNYNRNTEYRNGIK